MKFIIGKEFELPKKLFWVKVSFSHEVLVVARNEFQAQYFVQSSGLCRETNTESVNLLNCTKLNLDRLGIGKIGYSVCGKSWLYSDIAENQRKI